MLGNNTAQPELITFNHTVPSKVMQMEFEICAPSKFSC